MEYGYKPTTTGRSIIAACMAKEVPLTITRVMVGSGMVGEETDLADVHELLSPVASGTIAERYHKKDRLFLTVQYANSGHPEQETFYLSEFIVYATDPGTGEEGDLLYATLGDYQQPVPAYDPDLPSSVFSFPLVLVLSDKVQVSITAAPGIVTHDDLNRLMDEGVISTTVKGEGAPTPETVGQPGQHYFDAATGTEYICKKVNEDGTFVWEEAGGATKPGEGAPTPQTAGQPGQHYFDKTTGVEYICKKVNGDGTYVWEETGNTLIDDADRETRYRLGVEKGKLYIQTVEEE